MRDFNIALLVFAGISIWDITPHLRQILFESNIQNGFMTVMSRHTTTGSRLSPLCAARAHTP